MLKIFRKHMRYCRFLIKRYSCSVVEMSYTASPVKQYLTTLQRDSVYVRYVTDNEATAIYFANIHDTADDKWVSLYFLRAMEFGAKGFTMNADIASLNKYFRNHASIMFELMSDYGCWNTKVMRAFIKSQFSFTGDRLNEDPSPELCSDYGNRLKQFLHESIEAAKNL